MASRVTHKKLTDLLAVTLGDAKASTTLDETLRGLSVPPLESYTRAQVDAVLNVLSASSPGVAVAARLARTRLDHEDFEDPPSSRLIPPPARSSTALLGGSTRPAANERVDLQPFLAPSLGEDKARETVHQYARMLNVSPAALTRDQGIQLLDAMSQAAGLLGVVARFSKVRFLLRYPAVREE
jgi:hypothetical protein